MGFYYSLIFHIACYALKCIVLHVPVSMMAKQTSEWLAIWPAVQKNYF